MYNIRKNEEIMREWQRRYPNLPLIFDGVISPSRYWYEKVKVVICLKESVMYESGNPLEGTQKVFKGDGRFKDSNDSFYITDFLYETGGFDDLSFINECKIAELLLDGKISHKFDEIDGKEHRRQIFRRIAHVDLSKLGGTPMQSDWYEKVINDNKDLIGKQLSNFDANIYVVCGKPSWQTVKDVINLEKYKHLIVEVPKNGGKMEFFTNTELNKTLILMYHPSDYLRFEKQLDILQTWVNS